MANTIKSLKIQNMTDARTDRMIPNKNIKANPFTRVDQLNDEFFQSSSTIPVSSFCSTLPLKIVFILSIFVK